MNKETGMLGSECWVVAGCLYEMIGAICCLSSEMPFLLVMRGKQFSYLALKCELEGSKENGWRSVKKVPVKKRPKEAKKILFRAVNLAF